MARPPSLFTRLRELISPAKANASGDGALHRIGGQSRRIVRRNQPHDEPIVRLILGDRELTEELCKMAAWSREAIGVVEFLSSDPFQQLGGETSSWHLSPTKDGTDDGVKTHPDTLAIGRDLAARLNGKDYILGGDRMRSLLRSALFFGDGFAELEISKDGNTYGITGLVDIPSLQVFPVTDALGKLDNYVIRTGRYSEASEPKIEIPWWKVLQVSHQQRGILGTPLLQPQVDQAWRPLQSVAEDLLDVLRANGTAPWVHTFGVNTTEEDAEAYRLRIEEERGSRILTDLYMANGGKVERAPGGDRSIAAILEAFRGYQSLMIPPGVPSYLFAGLQSQDSAKEIAGQPALAYARKIAALRSLVGAQIRWAVSLEIVLRRGYDFYREHGQFEVAWGKWLVTGMESENMAAESARAESRINRLDNQLQGLADYHNAASIIDEVISGDAQRGQL
ncbi:MAG: hypothetical protein HC771_12180 [Synechococcales cyanobacterium CRU_2_2]|nr:hypothetical protein [Synechococcales cyanobacterium CRU_2_2]